MNAEIQNVIITSQDQILQPLPHQTADADYPAETDRGGH